MRYARASLIFLALLVGTSCSHLVYQPTRASYFDPKQLGYKYEDVFFKTSDGVNLHGWFFPAQGDAPAKGTVVQFHGNAQNITSHHFSVVWLVKEGWNLLCFDYRGYGMSGGVPSQEGLYKDSQAAFEFIQRKVPARKGDQDLVFLGQSLGGAVLLKALDGLKDRARVRAVVIDGSFHSYQEISRDILSRFWLVWPLQPLAYVLMSDEYSPEDSIERVSPIPLLVIHGDRDPVIPIGFGHEIYERAKPPKSFWMIKGGGHIDSMIAFGGRYRERLLEYLDRLK